MTRHKIGTGVGRYSATDEALDRERILDAWTERTKRGKVPGTHSLGVEFATRATQ